MNQSDRDEMLIRIDQKVINMEQEVFGDPPHSTIKEKVLLHNKVFWVTLSASIIAVIKSFWGSS